MTYANTTTPKKQTTGKTTDEFFFCHFDFRMVDVLSDIPRQK